MDSIKTLKTRIAPLMIVVALGSLLSACGSDRGIEVADGLGKGTKVGAEESALVGSSAPAVEAPAAQTGTNTPATTPTTPTTTTQTANGRVSLTWTPPLENTDGSSIANLSGYRVYFGTTADSLTQSVDIRNPGLTAYVLDNLPKGTTYFAITAYNATGAESALSGVGSKTIS